MVRQRQDKEVTGKEQVVCGKVTFLYGMAGVRLVDDLTSADQIIPDELV